MKDLHAMKQHTLSEIKQAVEEMIGGPESDHEDTAFKAAVLLLAAGQVGTDPLALSLFTGYHAEWVAKVHETLRGSGLITDEGLIANAGQWEDDSFGGTSFWLTVNAATGDATYDPATKKWQLTEQGHRRAEMLGAPPHHPRDGQHRS